jgi:uncharacterized protein (DUF1778 family)
VIKDMAVKKKREPKKEEPKRRKEVLKDKVILIRATEAQKKLLAEAAEKAGLGLSSWMLSVALREIQRAENEKK